MNEQKNLINKDKTWRYMVCLNPNHNLTIRLRTNEIGDIKCPICESLMVVEVKTPFQIIEE